MIAVRPKGAGNMPNKVLDTAMTRHADGFGLAWRDDILGLQSAKFGPQDGAAFRQYLKRIDKAGREYVAHFRFATHGPEDEAHAHPYEYTDPVEGRVLVFHNGIIDIHTAATESDTEVFVRDVLAHLESRWWANPSVVWLVSEVIGWSRLVIMTATETVNLQEKDGEWDGGLWYSSNHRAGYVYTGSSSGHTYVWPNERAAGSSRGWTSDDLDDIYPERDGAAIIAQRLGAIERVGTAGTLVPFRPTGTYEHGGHSVTVLRDIPLGVDGEYEDSVICNICTTTGDTWCIDGTLHFDMTHRFGDYADDDDVDEEANAVLEAERALARVPGVH